MSHIVLSRKLRPKTFDDVVGQDVIVKSLRNSILRNKIGHAYVFSGTRGVGKTSIARIFAKSLSCQNRDDSANPCLHCQSCLSIENGSSLDYLEIDGASHNSVDDVRDIISNVHTLPTGGNFKIYIIDEVHMLSLSAFNALLKTLEEPPSHVVFVLATTEPEKLPKTVLSRCQRFDFKQASVSLLVDFLKQVANKEGINFSNESQILKICRQGKGSIRDTLSLLDQILSFSDGKKITDLVISSSLGIADDETIEEIVHAVLSGNDELLIGKIDEVYISNIPLEHIYVPVLDHLYNLITLNEEVEVDDSLIPQAEIIWIFEGISRDVLELDKSNLADKLLAIILLKYCKRRSILGESVSAGQSKVLKKKFNLTEFLDFLHQRNPALCAQLEHGNLKLADWSKSSLVFIWAFNSKSSLFAENLSEPENIEKLSLELAEFCKNKSLKISISIEKNSNIVSLAEKKEIERKEQKEKLLEDFKSHHGIKEAQRIFSAKIDKIKIYD